MREPTTLTRYSDRMCGFAIGGYRSDRPPVQLPPSFDKGDTVSPLSSFAEDVLHQFEAVREHSRFRFKLRPRGRRPLSRSSSSSWDYRNRDEPLTLPGHPTPPPTCPKTHPNHLRPGLHGVPDEIFQPGRHLLHTESRGGTVVGGNPGTMVVRVVQNDQGSSLPPDLADAAPRFPPRARPGELVTLVDIDHFVEGNFAADTNWVVARAHDLHDHIIETFRGHVVTEGAIEEWK